MLTKPNVQLVPSPQVKRIMRNPTHTFYLEQKPFQVQPFLLAPVLAGETMKNLLVQCRTVTDPIKNSLIGWHLEQYFFYVKLRDLQDPADGTLIKDEIEAMVLQQSNEPDTGMSVAASVPFYHSGTDVAAWSKLCLTSVINAYFREPAEKGALLAKAIDGMPAARINSISGLDSLGLQSDIPADDAVVDGGGTTLALAGFEDAYRAYQHAKQLQITDLGFDDYLATFGVNIPKAENQEPELIRFVRNWQYPSNTVDPTDGSVASAVSWSVRERADKDRFFKEPGFLFGVQVARPKVYLSGQAGSLAGNMTKAMDWLPATFKEDVYSSLKNYANATGVLNASFAAVGESYYLDLRDLLIYGDQYVNIAITSAQNGIALPDVVSSVIEKSYPTEAMVDELFSSALAEKVRTDGVVSLAILGHQKDHT